MTTQNQSSQSQNQSNGVPMTKQSPSQLQNSMLLALATAIPSPRGDISTDAVSYTHLTLPTTLSV